LSTAAPAAALTAGSPRLAVHPATHAGKRHKPGGCKKGYVRQVRVTHKVRHHRKVTTRVSVCVKPGSTRGSGGSTGGSGSGSGGASGGGGAAAIGPPSVAAESYSVAAGATLGVGAPGVLTGAHGSGLSAQLVTGPAHGTLTLGRDGSFSYAPNAGFVGTDGFSFKALDKSFNSSGVASVTLTVTPVVNAASFSASSGTALSVPAPGLLAGAVGSGLSASVVAGPSHGSLTLSGDGSFTYTSTPGYVGGDSFTYHATGSGGSSSNIASVTISVGEPGPPDVVPQSFSGEIANTELQAGGARGGGAEVYFAGQNALSGASDPGGGTLSATPGTISTAHGGTVTMASDGSFTYVPPVGYEGPSDSFSYEVNSTDGQSSQAVATIDFSSGRVWYVDSSAGGGGNGTSTAPFATLAAASAAAGSGDVIFLAGGAYTGGITLGAGETLDGQSVGLTVGGETLLAASGSAPTITNGAGAGITLGEGDSVAGVDVANTSGDGIAATGINSFTIASSVTVSVAGADGLDVSGGSGTITVGASISGATNHSVAVANRSGGTVTLSGTLDDTGQGLLLSGNTGAVIDFTGTIDASTGAHAAFTATGGGTVNATGASSTLTTTTGTALDVAGTTIGSSGLTFLSISAGGAGSGPSAAIVLNNTGSTGALNVTGSATTAASGGVIDYASGAAALSFTDSGPVSLADMSVSNSTSDAIYADNVAGLTITGTQIATSGASSIHLVGDGTVSATLDVEQDTLTHATGSAIAVSLAGNAGVIINHDTIGTTVSGVGVSGSGSSAGDGVAITNTAGSVAAELENDAIYGVANQGIAASANGGRLDLTTEANVVEMQSGSGDAANYASATDASMFCLHTSGNTDSAAGSGANGTTVAQSSTNSIFEIQGLGATTVDPTSFLEAQDTLTGGSGGAGAAASLASGNSGFSAGVCTVPTGGGGHSS